MSGVTVVGIAFLLGMVQGSLFLSDYALGESWIDRLIISSIIAFVGGIVFGFRFPQHWFLAILSIWFVILVQIFGLVSLLSGHITLLEYLSTSPVILTVLLGGYLGRILRKKQKLFK